MQCTLRLLGAPVFLPLGLQTGVCNLAIYTIWMIWVIADKARYHLWMVIGNHSKAQDVGWNWPFVTLLDIKIATEWSTSHRTMWVSINYYFVTTTHTQPTNVISHHIIAFCACRRNCLELVTCPVKTCSSDQTVTPLIRVGSDWKALETQLNEWLGEYSLWISKLTVTTVLIITQLVCDKWRLNPMD